MVCLNRRLQRRLIQERLGQNRRLPTSPGPSPAPPRRLPAPEGPARGKRNTQKRRGHSFTVSVHFFAVEPEPAKQNIKAQAGDFAPRNLADPSGPRLARFCFHFTGEKPGSGGTSADSDPGLGLCPRSPLGSCRCPTSGGLVRASVPRVCCPFLNQPFGGRGYRKNLSKHSTRAQIIKRWINVTAEKLVLNTEDRSSC